MRGPTLNTNTEDIEEPVVSELSETKLGNETENCRIPCSRSVSNASSKKEDEDNNKPIWKVGRILIESLSKGKMRQTKIFGAPLEDLPLNCQGIPKIVQRLCNYLEQFGLKEPNLFSSCKKQGKLVERFKISFDRAGDADLESCKDVKMIASLLKLWLHDLPHPLIPQRISHRLKILFQKYDKKEIYDLDAEICNVLITCPALNLGVLYTVIRLLYAYVTKWYSESSCDQLPEMFAKILIGDIEMEHVEVISALIHNFNIIFNEKILERAFKLYVVRDKKNLSDGQKLPEVMLRVECKNSTLSVEKLPRSNSEEKLTMQNDYNQNISARNLNMRRVNSHEDFSGSQHNYCGTIQGHIANSATDNLPRRNFNEFIVDSIYDDEPYDNEPVVDHFQKITFASDRDSEALIAPPPFNYFEDDRVQEEIRNEERFTPQFNVHRCIGRKKKTIHQGHSGRTKVADTFDDNIKYAVSKPGEFLDRNVNACVTCPDEATELYHWNTMQDCDAQSTSSTSSSSSSGNDSPNVMLSPESAQYSREHLEPFNNYRNWSYTHRHPFSVKSTNLIQSENDEETMSSYVIRLADVDSKISQINKHLQWTKKRLRYYDKIYKDGGGDTLAGLKKMANQEYKQLSRTIVVLKKNLKQLRKEANENFVAHRSMMSKNPNSSCSLDLFSQTTDSQKASEKALKHLHDKRVASNRPECVEEMNHIQLLDEKVSIHDTLVSLENTFGQMTARNDESFKPIYELYRKVRRFLARSSISLKMKDAMSDLETIMENETMEFDTGSTNVSHSNGGSSPSVCEEVCNLIKSDFHTSNIHELSSPELMLEYKITKEEKKKLRNRIYLHEQETENQTINNSKYCIHTLRSRYKNTKAKLKLLEALLMKSK